MSETQQGIVKTINQLRGFGFLSRDGNLPDVFFHVKDLDPALTFDETLHGLRVQFETMETAKGLKAVGVRPV